MQGTLALTLSAWIATAAAGPPPAPPQFITLTAADGLPSSAVYQTVLDPQGFVWIGTQDGLARYDGIGFRVYRHDPADPASLPSNDVSSILIDRQGRLWCGGEANGLNRLDADGRGFTHWRHRAGDLATLGSDDVFAIVEDDRDVLWVGTYLGGLNGLQPDGRILHIDHDAEDPASLNSSSVSALHADRRGRLWIGTDVGVDVREADGRLVHVDIAPFAARSGRPIVRSIIDGGEGSVLVATGRGLFRIGADLRVVEELGDGAAPLNAGPIADDGSGGLWIATRAGVALRDAGGLHAYGTAEAVPGAYPNARTDDIRVDGEGSVWFSMHDAGIAVLPPHWREFAVFRTIAGEAASLTHPRIRAIGVEAGGSVWVASGADGLDRIDRESGRVERWAGRLHVAGPWLDAVQPIDADTLWVGSHVGLTQYSLRTSQALEIPVDSLRADSLPPGMVTRLVPAGDGSVWIGVNGGGIAHMQTQPPRVLERFTPAEKTLADVDLHALALDPHGQPWLATASGVARFDAGQRRFAPVADLPQQPISALAFAPDGSLWLSRLDALEHYALAEHAPRLLRRFDMANGWPPMSVAALGVAADGSVWVTSPRGLWRVDGSSGALRRFDVRDGLPSVEFVAGTLATARDGALYAGTLHGLVGFDPLRVRARAAPAPLRITALSVRRHGRVETFDGAATVSLRHDDADFRVEARALSFANPAANRYRFRLAGFDRDWVDGERGERTYSQLPPGRYALHVRATTAEGVRSELAAPLVIEVAHAPWATPAAYVVYAFAALVVAYGMFLGYRGRVRRQHARALDVQRRRDAEQLAEAKSNFLATMGHEIRTPMTGVLGMSELLLATPLNERQLGYATAIRQSGEVMLRVVNDSLDLARIDAGKLALDAAPFDPRELLRDVAAVNQPLAQRKGLAFVVLVDADVPARVVGDALRMKQVLLNLCNNALKFSERGQVTLALAQSEGAIEFRVEDAGPGMDADTQAQLFRRFEQAPDSTRRHGGSGLGLAICHELTQLMGGRIHVRSEPGVGTEFRVTLPLPAAPASDVPKRPPAIDAGAVGVHVLLVEDDATVAAAIGGLLGHLGHRVFHAENGLAALAQLQRTQDGDDRFAIALLDLDLPGIDGFTLARMLRGGAHADLPIIAITARSVGDEDARVRAAGMDRLLRKPVTAAMLAEAIDTALRTTSA